MDLFPQKVPFKASLVGEFNHYAIGIQQPECFQCMCFLALDCGAWRTDALHISWEDLDSFVFVPVALIPQVTQDDHLQVQNHHDCTRIAKDSSGDLDDHLQVQIHHD